MSNVSQRLDLRQSQNLVMTPQLQQAIKLLQMNNIELAEYIEEELEKNPLLEKGEPETQTSVEGEGDTTAAESSAPERDAMESGFDENWTGNEADTPSSTAASAGDYTGADVYSGTGAGGRSNFENDENSLENTLTRDKTLREHLLEQVAVDTSDARDRMLAALLIDQLDETGYLREGAETLAERLGCPLDRMQALLARLKKFDPPGIFARDLSECLALQLDDLGQLDQPMRILLQNLDKLASHDYDALARACGVNETYLRDMIDDIRALNPRPASSFDHFVVQTVIPDVAMRPIPKSEGGGWRVELNNDALPRVLVNQSYYTTVAGQAKSRQDKDYLSAQMNAASWLVKALDQRAKTILKVAAEIVEQQNAFFLFGIEFLQPLTLKDIAEKIEMHESTVSRVTTNKYIATPRGIFEMKYFFSTALVAADGTSHSAEAVKAKIKTMIDAEKSDAVLSDDAIVDALKAEGIDLARRTVAKYREGMNIPSSVQRRKQKKNSGPA
ncbi:RNA polymerase factor sigma-54 [Micavibrio aeruginosavorus]|uniref:RNA polymerase sigma-54 factor n=1 Tax=Micavibrio aeruginosavorus (strain ARL-13) TaxID=856793 RepID=G2KNZ7_MICAA|nr:RNA polymerase factor sigma-54 [Micavibrio aeruginosavorus]AEP08505.1 RNA polymerase sigma-54 factor [Micavibrio aeruginosavorus ARL-13]